MTTGPHHGRPTVDREHRITAEAADTLASLVQMLRTDWGHPGIYRALERNAPHATGLDLTTVLLHAARTSTNKTPAVIDHPGPHWDAIDTPTNGSASTTHTATARPRPCPIPEHAKIDRLAVNCPECRKLDDFPNTITREVYDQLDPTVQDRITNRPHIIITD